MLIRLQKILSGAGVASRRAAEKLMQEGRVSVNGQTVFDLGTKADPAQDEIRVDGSRIRSREAMRYLLLNKPRGYVTTRSDPQRRPTVLTLLGGVREYVYPVGRLDYDSEGLLLLTNDGELAARLTHPRHEVERLYEVTVRGVPDERALHRLASGLVIDGRRTAPAVVKLLPPRGRAHREDQSVMQLGLHEGRNRQVRKMCQAVGHPVLSLTRVRIGPISDSHLRTGEYRDLRPAEVAALKRAAGISSSSAGSAVSSKHASTETDAQTGTGASTESSRPRGQADTDRAPGANRARRPQRPEHRERSEHAGPAERRARDAKGANRGKGPKAPKEADRPPRRGDRPHAARPPRTGPPRSTSRGRGQDDRRRR